MTVEITPIALAELVEPLVPTALLAFDVDGVLAPIVEHAHDASLSPGVAEALGRLCRRGHTAIVSGRSVADLDRRFGFPPELTVIGSHGLEQRGAPSIELDDDERHTLDQLEILGTRAVQAAGGGAWLEHKPAGVVVHVRSADPATAGPAVEAVSNLARTIDGAQVKLGHMVVEMLARRANKGDALMTLREPGEPVVFLGDDVTDENAFAVMNDGDVSVRVGPGETAARYRLANPRAVVDFLDALAPRLP